MKKFSCIAAVERNGGIGKNNTVPWNLPQEYEYFQNTTKQLTNQGAKNVLLMGRLTFMSILDLLPYENRIIAILSKTLTKTHLYQILEQWTNSNPADIFVFDSLEVAMNEVSSKTFPHLVEQVFVVGGHDVYKEALCSPLCEKLHLTRLEASFECDVFFPYYNEKEFRQVSVSEEQVENGVKYKYHVYYKCV